MNEQGTPINEDALVTYAGVQVRYSERAVTRKTAHKKTVTEILDFEQEKCYTQEP